MVECYALAKYSNKISVSIKKDAYMVYIGYFYYYLRWKEISIMIELIVIIADTAHMVILKILRFTDAFFSSGILYLDCQFCFPVDVIPEFVINSLSFVTRCPTPFDQNPEYSGKSALCSDPVSVWISPSQSPARCLSEIWLQPRY